jgi:uncharacterized protein YndB with AHSA1/START domain
MIELSSSIVINRPVEEVFSYVTDAKNLSNWMSELVKADQASNGPMGLGTKINAVANVLGRQAESIQEVSKYELNRVFAIKSASGPVENEDEFTFEPDAGGTKVTRTTKGEIAGFFKMAEPLVVRMLSRQLKTNFANLKDLLETRA